MLLNLPLLIEKLAAQLALISTSLKPSRLKPSRFFLNAFPEAAIPFSSVWLPSPVLLNKPSQLLESHVIVLLAAAYAVKPIPGISPTTIASVSSRHRNFNPLCFILFPPYFFRIPSAFVVPHTVHYVVYRPLRRGWRPRQPAAKQAVPCKGPTKRQHQWPETYYKSSPAGSVCQKKYYLVCIAD